MSGAQTSWRVMRENDRGREREREEMVPHFVRRSEEMALKFVCLCKI